LSRTFCQDAPIASFSASPKFGGEPLQVQFTDTSAGNVVVWKWQFGDGSPVSALENPLHTFTNSGRFAVTLTITDDSLNIATTAQTIRVFPAPPPNDDFANRVVLGNRTNFVIGSNYGATMEPGEEPNGGVPGGHSVWWSWHAPVSGILTVSTAGSDFDTTLGVYQGACVSNLALVAFNNDADDANGILTSLLTVDVESNQTYQICVDGDASDTVFGDDGVIDLSVDFALRPQAAAWTAVDLMTNTVLSSRFAGRVLVLDFWATTCDACSQEIPVLVQLQSKYGQDGLSVVGASQDNLDSSLIDQYVTNAAINYLVVRSNPALEQDFGGPDGINSLPTIFIVDRQNGIAVPVFHTVTSLADLEQVILPLLYEHFTIGVSRTNAADVAVSWPVTGAAPILESTDDPASGVWRPVSAQVVLEPNRTRSAVLHPSTAGVQFYRVRLGSGD
jgi:thiol-disulfide isomerase/thioredoxin